jgi:hypothetical protein
MPGNRSLTEPKKPGQTERFGLPAGLAGFPVGIFGACKSDQVRFGEPCSLPSAAITKTQAVAGGGQWHCVCAQAVKRHHTEEEATWETEDYLNTKYPGFLQSRNREFFSPSFRCQIESRGEIPFKGGRL